MTLAEPTARSILLYRRIDLRDPRLPEEVQGCDRDAASGHGSYPTAAQTVEVKDAEKRVLI